VSTYFHKTKRLGLRLGDISSYMRSAKGGLGTVVRFYNVWAERRGVPAAFLLVRYEDLHRDAEGEVRRVLDFLGLPQVGGEAIRQAVEFASFENMRKLEARDSFHDFAMRPRDRSDPDSYKVRKGKVGGFVDYFGPEDVEHMNRTIEGALSDFYGYSARP
jgi:hypothetical protein